MNLRLLYLSSSKSGHIQNDISSKVFAGISDSISQDQATFCISVIDFHSSGRERGHFRLECFGLEVRTHLSGLEHFREQPQTSRAFLI